MLYGGSGDYGDLPPDVAKGLMYTCAAVCEPTFRKNPLNALNCFNGCSESILDALAKRKQQEGYKPYNPFYSDSLSSRPRHAMWIIILILVVGFIIVMSQKK